MTATPAPPIRRWTAADVLTGARIPLAVAFVLAPTTDLRVGILWAAGISDFSDGWVARRFGSSRLGSFLDPLADKLFIAAAFGVVLFSGALRWWEILLILSRDIAATIAFLLTIVFIRPSAIPARVAGKLVTIGQLLVLLAFLIDSSLFRPLVWVTGAGALYAIVDYVLVARQQHRTVGD